MATIVMIPTVVDDFNLDEYTINQYKDSDYYVDKYNDDELYKYYQSTEYLEGLEALDDYVAFKTYDQEFDSFDVKNSVGRLVKSAGKKKNKNKYAALPLVKQVRHFIKVERKRGLRERKRIETKYLLNKQAERSENKMFVEEDIDYDSLGCTKDTTLTLIKDAYCRRMEEEDLAILLERAYYT